MRLTKALLASLTISDIEMMRIADAARDIEHIVNSLQDVYLNAQESDNKELEFVMDRLSGDAMLVMDRLQTIASRGG